MKRYDVSNKIGPARWTANAAVALLALTAVGCASTGSTGGDEPSERRNVLTEEQIAGAQVSHLLEVVERLRPEWLRVQKRSFSGESRVVVIENGTVLGGVEVLRQFAPDGVVELRFMDGDMAAATLVGGRDGFIEGAIVIERSGSS